MKLAFNPVSGQFDFVGEGAGKSPSPGAITRDSDGAILSVDVGGDVTTFSRDEDGRISEIETDVYTKTIIRADGIIVGWELELK